MPKAFLITRKQYKLTELVMEMMQKDTEMEGGNSSSSNEECSHDTYDHPFQMPESPKSIDIAYLDSRPRNDSSSRLDPSPDPRASLSPDSLRSEFHHLKQLAEIASNSPPPFVPLWSNLFWPETYDEPLNLSMTNRDDASMTPSPSPTPSTDDDRYVLDLSKKGEIFVCSECEKAYSTASNLARHRQTHRSVADNKARKCPHCDKIYVSMPAFAMHIRTHSQGCKCPYCEKSFSRPWLLQGHIRTHTGEKPFTCTVCSKAFADKSNLRAHAQTHSNAKPYSCSRCGKAFALKSYLYKHEESSCMRTERKKAPVFDRN